VLIVILIPISHAVDALADNGKGKGKGNGNGNGKGKGKGNGDSKEDGNGRKCPGDCEPPTLGLDENYVRVVDSGFTYNGQTVDVKSDLTPFPLITTNVGEENIVVLKVHENTGIENIAHVAIAFGLGSDEFFSESLADIALDIEFDGTKTIIVTDPKKKLENIRVETDEGKCREGDFSNDECLIVTFYHTFRESFEFNKVASYVWDMNRNGQQNFYNDGVRIVGESLNPPTTEKIVDEHGKIHILTIKPVSKNLRLDENNHLWIQVKDVWQPYKASYNQLQTEIESKKTPTVTDFNSYDLQELKGNQVLIAEKTISQLYHGKIYDVPDEN